MKKIVLMSFLLLGLFSCTQKKVWPEITRESKPWTRWWWMGNAVDKENLSRELNEMNKAGIGGVEITSIYGVKGEEKRSIEYLSPQYSELLQFTIGEADRLDMGVDIPPGSGWRCGGPFVPEVKGLWNLSIEKFEVRKGTTWKLDDKTERVIAISVMDSRGKIGIIDRFNPVWNAIESSVVYVARLRKNGDKVKRAADGGTGWAIDTFNKEITDWYLREFWNRLSIPEEKVRCFFHDSFEYTGDITTDFVKQFKNRRGYDPGEYLYVLSGDCRDDELSARVRSDYRETLADLVLESFIMPMTAWANGHKSLNRNQAHGSPGNLLDLYAACDIPETEIFRTIAPGSTDVFINKFASSPAHIYGRRLVSSESFTWLKEHWTVTTSDMMRASNRFFLAGINHMFFHGTCYSPADAEWPGWLFYASTQVNNRNPLWKELPTLFSYIARSQSVMQNSKPDNDLLVYWPYYDVLAEEGRLFNHIGVNASAGWFNGKPIDTISRILLDNGYTFDYISESQISECSVSGTGIHTPGNAVYKAIVVPQTRFMPVSTLQKLENLVKNGAKVFFSGHLPLNVPGLGNLNKRQASFYKDRTAIDSIACCGDIVRLLKKNGTLGEESLRLNGFYFNRLTLGNEIWYQVFNCSNELKDAMVKLNVSGKFFLMMDPETGMTGMPQTDGDAIRIQLLPERSLFIRCSSKDLKSHPFNYLHHTGSPDLLEGTWKVEFIAGGPSLPAPFISDSLKLWTEIDGTDYERFAGTACYSFEFTYDGDDRKATLDLGAVYDCARVRMNRRDFGVLLGPGYMVNIDNLKKGKNLLEIEVTNVAANRIRDFDKRGVNWKKFHDINFVNIDYQPFDASDWEITPAGLKGPVVMTTFE